MPYVLKRLTQAGVDKTIEQVDAKRAAGNPVKAGSIADGGGLYLRLPNCNYVSRLRMGGRRLEIGHGSARPGRVRLAQARIAHEKALQWIRDNKNPVVERKMARKQAAAAKTFGQAAREFMPVIEAEVKSTSTVAMWRSVLLGEIIGGDGTVRRAGTNYCAKLRNIPIEAIGIPQVLEVLDPIWTTKHETASRLRGMIERILSWAVARGMAGNVSAATYLNPARWNGALEHALAAGAKVHETKHRATLPYQEIPAFYAALAKRDGMGTRAFQLALLTACRTGDLHGQGRDDRPPMRWEHVDLEARMWTVPKTKTGVEHRVPLSTQAVTLLKNIRDGRTSGIVFVGDKPGQPISDGTILAVRNRMVRAGEIAAGTVTPHGIARAGFKSWASEETTAERDVIEACMTHVISDQVEAAYRRTDFYAKRIKLMQDWADYVTSSV